MDEQEIPDDGNWLQICWNDPSAPEQSTVTAVHVKYLIDHPDPSQLEVRLTRDKTTLSQTLWERGNAIEGFKLGEAARIETFNGTPSQGNWYLLIRDAVPGGAGKLQSVTIRPDYAPVEPIPPMLSGTPGQPTSFRIPSGIAGSNTPDADEKKIPGQNTVVPRPLGSWQNVKGETFEGVFPNTGWTLIDANPNDNREYLWDDDDFRPHYGSWAGWPANGGINGLDPASNSYPSNMASWMIYGPFDLSNARMPEAVFWLWRQIEVTYDYIFFGVSHDGSNFSGYRWDGTAGWEEKHIDLSGYLGDSSVWVGWLFVSDGSLQYEGPWVDDILIHKYVPGQVTAQGTLSYSERNGNSAPGRFTKVYLYDQDPGGSDDLLAITTTDVNGFFQFPSRMNWDDDDSDPDLNNRRLDIYLVFEADYNDSATSRRRVTNTGGQTYTWPTSVLSNISDGTTNVNVPIPNGFPTLGAMWIFQDLRRTWETIYYNTSLYIDPGSVTAKWGKNINCYTIVMEICSSFFWPYYPLNGIFIADNQSISADIVVHELAHQYMYNAIGFWYWSPSNWDDFYHCVIQPHFIFGSNTQLCAWTEGWGDFLALAVNNTDACFDWGTGPCGAGGIPFENIETPTWGDNRPQGDIVEGRVAGALYDLWDNTNEPSYDSATFGLAPIVKIVLQGAAEDRFSAFWESWKASGQNKHHAVRAIYQNTIDYDTPPNISGLPDWNVPHGSTWSNAFNLLGYSSDAESSIAELAWWQIIFFSDPRCGVSIDSLKNIDIAPQANWQGFCDITVQVSDSLATGTDQFRVYVTQDSFADVPLTHWAYSWIERVYADGITGGCADDPRRYCPEANVTRAQIAVFLLRGIHGAGYTPPAASGTMFADVPSTYWAAAWIEQLAREGITSGCGGGNYCPENPVTRAQITVFLLRSKYGAGYTPLPASGTMFADVPSSYWAAAWIEQLAREGITGGCGGGNYCPENPVTRAQVAVFLVKTFNLP